MSRNRTLHINRTKIEEPTVNLTPLIDVVFVILIIFIVIAPLLELERVELASNQFSGPQTSSVQETSPIAIHVHSDDTIRLNNRIMVGNEFLEQLKIERTRHPTAQPQVFLDKKAHFGTYQVMKNTVEQAGFTNMDIILQPS
jgi:biopolymer transport protein ExbD